jgi:hypothetical protein
MNTVKFASLATVLALSCGATASAQTVGIADVPSGFGLAGGVLAFSLAGSYGPERGPVGPDNTRFDASSAILAGFGNPVAGLGVQGGINLTSFRNFGESGYFSFGVHKLFQTSDAGVYSVALNVGHLAPWGDAKRLDPGVSLVGTYLTSLGGNLAMISVGAATDNNDARDVKGVFGFGLGVSDTVALSIGQAGNRTALGVTFAPSLFAGNFLSVSINHNRDTNDNTLVVNIGRAFSILRN